MDKNRCKELRGNRPQTVIASFLGITQQQYSNIEKSDKPPKIETCIKLSQFFNKPIDYIFPQIFLTSNTSKNCERWGEKYGKLINNRRNKTIF